MDSKIFALVALFLSFNLLFFSLQVTAATTTCTCSTPPTPKPKPKAPPSPKPTPSPSTPKTPPSPKPTPAPSIPKTPPTHKPTPTPTPRTPPSMGTCPIDTLKLGVCANLLGGLVGGNSQCCTLLQGLADMEASVCLCTAIRANVLGINLNAAVSLSLILNNCGNKVPSGFKCA